ncbi:amylovoran biosynthesis protein AmsE, partial [Acinetobacter baumannii]|nr:amylovoran biosynthesis protein AmsE [Acinetobacter baumannii]
MFSVLMSLYHKEKPEHFNTCMASIWDQQTLKTT